MTQLERAKRELKLAGLYDKNSDYNGAIGESVQELLETFTKQGHSGYSASIVSHIFNQLISGDKILTPLTGNADEWTDISEACGGEKIFQNNRRSSVFKNDTEAYDIDGGPIFKSKKDGCTYTNKDSVLHNITFPYTPQKREVIEVDDTNE